MSAVPHTAIHALINVTRVSGADHAWGRFAEVTYQPSLCGGREAALNAIEPARAGGYSALVVTIDTLVAGMRERNVHNTGKPRVFKMPAYLSQFATRHDGFRPAGHRAVRLCGILENFGPRLQLNKWLRVRIVDSAKRNGNSGSLSIVAELFLIKSEDTLHAT